MPEENRSGESSFENWICSHSDLVALVVVGAGLLVRLQAASGTFLNYDEALHFSVANQVSWRLTYQASSSVSHPPLLIFLLHAWRALGTSEFMLRLPSLLLGAGSCWFSFKWMKDLFGSAAALIGLIFLAFSPPLVSLSAEVRQYAPLLFFAACALYLFERALEKDSPGWMLLFLLCLYLALLSHYSGIFFAASLGVYAILRMVVRPPSAKLAALWAAGQALGLGICAFLYSHYIVKLGHSALHGWMGDTYLHNSYFDPHHHNLLVFVITRSVSLFQYVFGQSVVGAGGFLLFIAGIVLLWRTRESPGTLRVRPYALIAVLLLPFAIDCIAALAGKYPYGGTRHCAFLAIFGMAGIGFALARLVKQRIALGLPLAVLIVAACSLFPSRRLPYIAKADQSMPHMRQLLEFVGQNVAPSDLVFADNQSGMLLRHYLCQQQPIPLDESVPGYGSFECHAHRIVQTDMEAYFFTAENFLPRWEQLPRTYGLRDGDTVWILQAGWLWEDTLAQQLQRKVPQFHNLTAQSFGHNITIFKLVVGRSSEPLLQ